MNHAPLTVCSHAIRTCWQSFDRSDNGGPKDRELIDRVGNKNKHASTLEHLVYTFYIAGISRALLQELARHRVASLSVKSTRYTLKELAGEGPIVGPEQTAKYCVLTGHPAVDLAIEHALDNLRVLVAAGVANDLAKFALPDAYKTELTWTINARSLQNFLSLRTAPGAMWEIRRLAHAVFNALPEDHRYLFEAVLTPPEIEP
jgi:thymidylate synthase (FAD)